MCSVDFQRPAHNHKTYLGFEPLTLIHRKPTVVLALWLKGILVAGLLTLEANRIALRVLELVGLLTIIYLGICKASGRMEP